VALSSNRTLGVWLAASLLGSGVLAGGGSLVDRRPSVSSVYVLEDCDLGDGRVGHLFDGLCLDAPPIAWDGPDPVSG
jgi:hypothetical protein